MAPDAPVQNCRNKQFGNKHMVGLIILRLALMIGLPLVIILAATSAQNRRANKPSVMPTADAELGTGPINTELGGGPNVEYEYRQTSFYEDNVTKRLVKTVFQRKMPYIVHSNSNGYLIGYEYYRTDGTLEQEKVVFPGETMDSSVATKYIVRKYDDVGKDIVEQRNYRADNTLSSLSDKANHTLTQFRRDGKTLRCVQTYDGENYYLTYYRLDGKTVWWVYDYSQNSCKTFFDREGNNFEREFTRRYLFSNVFVMGSGDPPKPLCEDSYKRADGTLEYRQTWYRVFINNAFVDCLAELEVFSEDGQSVINKIVFEPRPSDQPLVIKTESNPDPNNANSNANSKTPNVPSYMLQGFGGGLDLYGVYDDDSHDK
jgi:hypothetical protein